MSAPDENWPDTVWIELTWNASGDCWYLEDWDDSMVSFAGNPGGREIYIRKDGLPREMADELRKASKTLGQIVDAINKAGETQAENGDAAAWRVLTRALSEVDTAGCEMPLHNGLLSRWADLDQDKEGGCDG